LFRSSGNEPINKYKTMTKFDQNVARYKAEGHKVLELIIKGKYFTEILNGTKKAEYREIKPSTEKKYIRFGTDGYPLEDENGNCVPIKYDALLLHVGYNSDRDNMLVECTGAETEVIFDDEGEPAFYFYSYKRKAIVDNEVATFDIETGEAFDADDKKIEDAEMYFVEQITYHLGQVLATDIH